MWLIDLSHCERWRELREVVVDCRRSRRWSRRWRNVGITTPRRVSRPCVSTNALESCRRCGRRGWKVWNNIVSSDFLKFCVISSTCPAVIVLLVSVLKVWNRNSPRSLALPVDVIWAMMIVWRIRGKIIRTVLCCVVYRKCTMICTRI